VSPDLIGVIIGVVFIVPTIVIINKRGFDDWAWAFFLATLPLYYMLFGIIAMDGKVIGLELLAGLPYIVIGWLLWKASFRLAWLLIAVAWISHGFYDYYHDFLFINPGVFSWYPAFCALVDVVVGFYLLLNTALRPASNNV
jgi:hypothetical protein